MKIVDVRLLLCIAVSSMMSSLSADFKKPVEPKNVPELLVTSAGERISNREDWESKRRPELLKMFLENEYGIRPVERPADLAFEECAPAEDCFDGKAVRKRIRGTYSGPGGRGEIVFSAWIPKLDHPVPAFVHCSPRPHETAADRDGPRPAYYLPAEYIVSRGYAAIAYCNVDATPDFPYLPDVPTSGVFKVYGPKSMSGRSRSEWGIISAWSWGLSRIMDWIETESLVDARRVGVVGLSRNGKTALHAGVTDTRFAMVVSCCSGCCGARMNHIEVNQEETIERIMKPAWMWFCAGFADYIGKDLTMPFDQYQWLALVAPRLLYVSSASEDCWAFPRGEFHAARLASSAWELYGKAGLVEHGFPKPDMPLQAGNVAYHLRTGLHDICLYDWQCYLDFADGHGWRLNKEAK